MCESHTDTERGCGEPGRETESRERTERRARDRATVLYAIAMPSHVHVTVLVLSVLGD